MSTREELLDALEAMLDREGKQIVVSPLATVADLEWMIRHHSREVSPTLYRPSGVHTQIGGNRVQFCPTGGLQVRPAYDPRIIRIDKQRQQR